MGETKIFSDNIFREVVGLLIIFNRVFRVSVSVTGVTHNPHEN